MNEIIFHKEIINCISDTVIVTKNGSLDGEGPEIIYVNPAFTQLTGYRPEEVIGKTPKILQGPDTDDETRKRIRTALKFNKPIHTEILNYTKTGNPYWVDLNILPLQNSDDEFTHFIAIERDLTEQKRMQRELHRLAHMDALTGITNREHFMLLAESEFYRAKRYQRPLAIVMFDLDNFKHINKVYGHQFGDDALKIVAENCRTLLRKSDIFGRIGGEKFAMLLPETCVEAAEELADRLCMLLCVIQIKSKSNEILITASFGVTTASDTDDSLFDVLERADYAIIDAKKCGRNTVRTREVENVHYLKKAN